MGKSDKRESASGLPTVTAAPPVNPFGTALAKQPTTTSRSGIPDIPIFLCHAIEYLEENGLKHEGIFRISGSSGSISKLRTSFETGERTSFVKGDEPYDVACLVKLFFRELPDSLLTFELYDCFIAAQGFPEEYITSAVTKILDMLPPQNLMVLMYIVEFAKKVIQYESVNKMGASNLAIVLAPNIVRPQEESIEIIVGDSQRSYNTILVFIESYDAMFKKYREKLDKRANPKPNPEAEKALAYKEELAKKYASHKQEIEEHLSNELHRRSEAEQAEWENQLAEKVAKIKVGALDDSVKSNEENWDAVEYKKTYKNTLRGMKSAKFVTRPKSGGTLPSHNMLGKQRVEPAAQRKTFTLNTNPTDLSKMYFGTKK